MIIGYARVSKAEQKLDRQLDQLEEYGCERIYAEKMTGKKLERGQLEDMISNLRPADLVVVSELSRISRSTRDLLHIADKIRDKGADIKSLKEDWVDTSTPQGKLIYTIFTGLIEFEHGLIVQRVNEGIKAARVRGRVGGRPGISQSKKEIALKMYDSREYSISQILEAAKISRGTLYKYVRERNSEGGNLND